MAHELDRGEHTVTLSTIDQSLVRGHIRYCLCFPHQNEDTEDTVRRLKVSVNSCITKMPILAGYVRPLRHSSQAGRLEICVSAQDVENFLLIVRKYTSKELPHTYETLAEAGMPPALLVNPALTPLSDDPNSDGGPVFAIQANSVPGGLLLALYLHHSVADALGFAMVMDCMSHQSEGTQITEEDLTAYVANQNMARQLLSQSRGAEAHFVLHPEYHDLRADMDKGSCLPSATGTCSVFFFSLQRLESLKCQIVSNHYLEQSGHEPFVSTLDCLCAIVWKAVIRARRLPVNDKVSRLAIPVSVRGKVDPAVPQPFFGNACVLSIASLPIGSLTRTDISAISEAAGSIRSAIRTVDDAYVRSAIAVIESYPDVRHSTNPNIDFDSDIVITSWADLPLFEADQGLGLGTPEWGRKSSRAHSAYGCIVLPVRREEGMWEVMIQMTTQVMASLLDDAEFMKFVERVTD